MKASLSLILFIYMLICSCTSQMDKKNKKFTLHGEITCQDSGIVVLTYYSDYKLINDSAEIRNGKFLFTGRIFEPTMATLRDGNDLELAVVYLDPGKMNIVIFKDKLFKFKMAGSKTQAEYDLLNKMEEPIYERISELKARRIIINDSIKSTQNVTVKLLLEKKGDEIDSICSIARRELDPIELKFVLEHPKSFVTLDYFPRLESRDVISIDSLKSIFNGLGSSLRKSPRAKIITENLRKKENVQIGKIIPDISIIDINNQTITFSQFRDKNVVLIDFWASWCVPCRESFPHLREIYNQYHPQGLEIIAVAWLEKNKETWIEAINQEKIENWNNATTMFRNGEIYNKDISDNFAVPAIPFTLIIDKTGKIIYRHVGYSKESEESLDTLLSQIF